MVAPPTPNMSTAVLPAVSPTMCSEPSAPVALIDDNDPLASCRCVGTHNDSESPAYFLMPVIQWIEECDGMQACGRWTAIKNRLGGRMIEEWKDAGVIWKEGAMICVSGLILPTILMHAKECVNKTVALRSKGVVDASEHLKIRTVSIHILNVPHVITVTPLVHD